jgi:hypothetical protein
MELHCDLEGGRSSGCDDCAGQVVMARSFVCSLGPACEREGGGSRSSPESARSPGGMSSSWVNNQGVPHGYRNLGGRPAARESLADTSTWLCILLLCRRLTAGSRSKIPPALAQGRDWNSSYRFRTEREVAKNAWFSIISLRCGFTARGSRNTKCLGTFLIERL